MKKAKALFITIFLVVIMGVLAVGCIGGGSATALEDGTYTVDRIYINGVRVADTHAVWSTLAAANGTWVIDGQDATFSHSALQGVPANSMTVRYRIRGGYLEQRSPAMNNNRWTRENGSAASGFTSTRVEDGQIVVRFGVGSAAARVLGGRVYVFYAIEGGAYDSGPSVSLAIAGRWNLTETYYGEVTTRPGDLLWIFEYFISFSGTETSGTFTEVNFWNPIEMSGTWTLNGSSLVLTLTGEDAGTFAFASQRTISISGNTMTMTYNRPMFGMYRHTFVRA